MMDILELPRVAGDWQPRQWRGSVDGLRWSRWNALHRLTEHVHAYDEATGEAFEFAQAGVLIDGAWHTSPVTSWD